MTGWVQKTCPSLPCRSFIVLEAFAGLLFSGGGSKKKSFKKRE